MYQYIYLSGNYAKIGVIGGFVDSWLIQLKFLALLVIHKQASYMHLLIYMEGSCIAGETNIAFTKNKMNVLLINNNPFQTSYLKDA